MIFTVQKEILVEEEVPRVVSKQLHCGNTPGSNPREYYKNNITIPMLDHLSTCMDSRFNEKTRLVYKAFSILPNYIIDSVSAENCKHWKKNVIEFD